VLLFTSDSQLTSYDNQGYSELYRYSIATNMLACVSCDPSGAPPVSTALLQNIRTTSVSPTPAAIEPRNLSANGGRVFFQTVDSLRPGDTNGVQDVYEWEQDGEGSCTSESSAFVPSNAGCVLPISTGLSPTSSYFAGASVDGNDVFFFTDQQLVVQDKDTNVDVYDARVDGGIAAQNEGNATPCEGEECRPQLAGMPPFPASASNQLLGEGNAVAATPTPAPKPASTPAQLTRKQKLSKALAVCRRKHGKQRNSCEKRARQKFGSRSKAKKTTSRKTGGSSR
jgi:hypothetical protein